MIKKQPFLLLFTLLCFSTFCSIFSQNLLNTSSWAIGSGSVAGFGQNGSDAENSRELGHNHIGESVMLWKATPDTGNNQDGGWNTSYHAIDNTKSYRFSVWIKRTKSANGTTYFGWQSYISSVHHSLNLNGSVNSNPYFWAGDLPKLDRWYLLVGFVHKSSYGSSSHLGKMYDGVTGEAVLNISDFKFAPTATKLLHRAYLYYDVSALSKQYFYEPRIDIINGTEPNINSLLSLNPDSKLIFAYDNAGNQKQRFYCEEGPSCNALDRDGNSKTKGVVVQSFDRDEPEDKINKSAKNLDVYPNPTSGIIAIQYTSTSDSIRLLRIYSSNGAVVHEFSAFNSDTSNEIDFSDKPSGVYFFHFHFENSESITKRIIKN